LIANNATEEGREANRRIEFTLLREFEPGPAPSTVAEAEAAVAAQKALAEASEQDGVVSVTAEDPAIPNSDTGNSAGSDPDSVLTIAAANAPDPINGAVRSITIPDAGEGADDLFVFEAIEEIYPRPPRRP